ncbi:MAG: hypothetical protein FWG11_01660 [Promicromonosporaceae bacterium]|nr:hypothetical protein [Promicromonosporaceae bacterium]
MPRLRKIVLALVSALTAGLLLAPPASAAWPGEGGACPPPDGAAVIARSKQWVGRWYGTTSTDSVRFVRDLLGSFGASGPLYGLQTLPEWEAYFRQNGLWMSKAELAGRRPPGGRTIVFMSGDYPERGIPRIGILYYDDARRPAGNDDMGERMVDRNGRVAGRHHKADVYGYGFLPWACAAPPVVEPAPPPPPEPPRPGNRYLLRNLNNAGGAHHDFTFGRADDAILVGDWDGSGVDTIAVRRGNQIVQAVGNHPGSGTTVASFGRAGETIYVGDWDGDGTDTFAIRRGNLIHLTNNPRGGVAEQTFSFGRAGDELLVGDWNGNGIDTFGIRRGNQIFLTNQQYGTGQADVPPFTYGRTGDTLLVGDWNGNGSDTVGIWRDGMFYQSNSLGGGQAHSVFRFGRDTDLPVVGNWNGAGGDSIGVRRNG